MRDYKIVPLITACILSLSCVALAADRLLGMVEPVTAKRPYRIALASTDMNADFWLGLAYGVVDETSRSGAQMVRVVSAGGFGKVAEQVGQLEQLGTLGLDAVVLAPAAFNGYDRVIDRLVSKGTKVISIDPMESSKVTFGVIQDDTRIGRTLGEFVCHQKPNATVITLPGPAGSEWNAHRFAGFKEEAAKCNLNLVGNIFEGNIALEDGQRQAADQLLKHPDADYIYAVAGIFSVGVAQEINRMHSKAKVITGTFTRRTRDFLKDGTMAVVISEPPIVLGRGAVQYALRLLNGDPLPNVIKDMVRFPVAIIPNKSVTPAEVDSYDLDAYDLPPVGWKPPQLQ
jgi:ABC-type sugar transport system substrate-binding protein